MCQAKRSQRRSLLPAFRLPLGKHRSNSLAPCSQHGPSQEQNHHTGHHKGHSSWIPLEPSNHLNAPADISAAVGHGSGPRNARIAAIGHSQKRIPVSPPRFPLQPLQHPLVTEGFHIQFRTVNGQANQGIAPMQSPANAPNAILQRIPVLDMEQLMEKHRLIHRSLRQHHHRTQHTKDQRGRKPRQNNHPANPQSIPLPYFMNGSLDFQWCRMPQPKTAAQPEIGKKIPQQHHPYPEAVKKEQPVCHAGWKASNPWNRGCHLRHLVKRRIGGGQVPLNHSF